MITLTSIQSGEVVALGWTLLHFLWQSSAIVLFYAVLDRCCTSASASIRYGMALGALALLPLAFAATLLEQEQLVSHSRAVPHLFVTSQLGVMHAALMEQLPVTAPVVSRSELWIAGHSILLLPCLDGVWLAGVLFLALRAAGGWLTLRALGSRAQVNVPKPLLMSFDRLASRYHVSRRVALRVTDEVISPMVFGLWRTVVLLPLSAVASLAPEQLESVLAHELAHVRRWDYLCNLLQTSVECLFFFQPAVWWLSRKTREFRETCCDEVAAKACADPAVYAEALLQLEEQRVKHLQLATALHGDGTKLMNRIRRILGENAMEQRSVSGIRILAAAAVLSGLLLAPHIAHGIRTRQTHAPEVAGATAAAKREAFQQAASAVSELPVRATIVAASRPELPAMPPQTTSPVETVPPSAISGPISGAQLIPSHGDGGEYLKEMQDAGYPLELNKDLDQVITLRSIGVTPEYAKAMAQTGLGMPSLHDLVTLRSIGVTPEYVASLKGTPLAPASFHDIVTTRSLGVTTEYARSMDSLGLGRPTMHEVVSLKSMGITPEYVAALKASGIPAVDLREVVSMKAVGVTPEYARGMTDAGYPGLTARDLISLRAQGMTPEYARWLKSTFPEADSHAMRQAAVFHIDADFVAKARANGFNSASLDKLTRLKTSGLLD